MTGDPMTGQAYILCTVARDFCIGVVSLVLSSLLVYLVVQILHPGKQGPGKHEPPLLALKKRYARGEITQDEYEQARQKMADQGSRSP